MSKWGGIFDFNHDGKESIFEKALAFKMYQEMMNKKEEPDDSRMLDDFDIDDSDDWRMDSFLDDECALDPYDYDTKEEYEEAKEEWELERMCCDWDEEDEEDDDEYIWDYDLEV